MVSHPPLAGVLSPSPLTAPGCTPQGGHGVCVSGPTGAGRSCQTVDEKLTGSRVSAHQAPEPARTLPGPAGLSRGGRALTPSVSGATAGWHFLSGSTESAFCQAGTLGTGPLSSGRWRACARSQGM